MVLNDNELINVSGGAISSTLLNAVSRLISTVLELGRTIGTAIYRIKNKKYCK